MSMLPRPMSSRLPTIVARDVALLPKMLKKKNMPSKEAIKNQLDKLERDERMDIARCMTPSKTYRGGFTQPKAFKIFDHMPGGKYASRDKFYPFPVQDAYDSYTVYILESREIEPGRMDLTTRDTDLHHVGFCRTRDFEHMLRSKNAPKEPRERPDPNVVVPIVVRTKKQRRAKQKAVKAEVKAHRREKEKAKESRESRGMREIGRETPAHLRLAAEAGPSRARGLLSSIPSSHNATTPPAPRSIGSLLPPAPASRDQQASGSLPNMKRGIHTSLVAYSKGMNPPQPTNMFEIDEFEDADTAASEDAYPTRGAEPAEEDADAPVDKPTRLRSLKKLPKYPGDGPHWRPLITLTTFSRPLADTIERMVKASERGTPYHAQISKASPGEPLPRWSYGSRIRCLKVERMTQLAVIAAELMLGARGGMVGMRLSAEELGRGLDGMEMRPPWEKRMMRVGVGEWYPRAAEVREAFEMEGQEVVRKYGTDQEAEKNTFVVERLDEFGKVIVDVESGEKRHFWAGQEEWDREKAAREKANVEAEAEKLLGLEKESFTAVEVVRDVIPRREGEELRDMASVN